MTIGTNWICEVCGENKIAEVLDTTVTINQVKSVDFDNGMMTYGQTDTLDYGHASYECWSCGHKIKDMGIPVRGKQEFIAYLKKKEHETISD